MHPYEQLPLFHTGLVLGVVLLLVHGVLFLKPDASQRFFRDFMRNATWGQVLTGLGLGWFWLLIAPPGLGIFSSLAMDFGDFNAVKPMLRILVPLLVVGISISVRDFLAVRALGLLGLLAAAPLLDAAFLDDPKSRLLIPIYVYPMLTAAMFCVGMPYLFRDTLNWAAAEKTRWNLLALTGAGYGLAIVLCALAFWRGH